MKRLLLAAAATVGVLAFTGCTAHNPRSEACQFIADSFGENAYWVSNSNYAWGGYCRVAVPPVNGGVQTECRTVILARDQLGWYDPSPTNTAIGNYCAGL